MKTDMTVIIGERVWEVKRMDSHDPEMYVDGNVCIGSCWDAKNLICISNELKGSAAEKVIGHELTHAIIASTQIHTPENYSEEDLADFGGMWSVTIAALTQDIMRELLNEEERNEV